MRLVLCGTGVLPPFPSVVRVVALIVIVIIVAVLTARGCSLTAAVSAGAALGTIMEGICDRLTPQRRSA